MELHWVIQRQEARAQRYQNDDVKGYIHVYISPGESSCGQWLDVEKCVNCFEMKLT